MLQDVPDWSELPYDLLVLIGRCLNLIVDYIKFCKSWHSAATKNNFNSDLPRVPWLMLAEEEDNEGNSFRRFFSLYDGMILKKRIPKASRKRYYDDPDDHLADWMMTFIRKAVLSASPSHKSDYVVVVIEGGTGFLSFWRPGDLRWTRVVWEGTYQNLFVDLLYFNGKIYTVNYSGEVLVCDVDDVVGPQGHIIAQIPFEPQGVVEHLYILESLGSLFVISRYGVQVRPIEDDCVSFPLTLRPDERELLGDGEFTNGTTDFRVFQVDLATGKVTETEELGDMAFFLGANASLSVQASQFPGIKPNHIYFTDDCFESYLCYEEGGGLDMGVFNVADGNIQPHYDGVSLSSFCPPIWVTPTSY
ncbi:hypothetical protein BC332_08882 [Capsicum chinense]|nr:hypothetical protein BC332_08882 [Capsicum chinense]